eukprot:380229_1
MVYLFLFTLFETLCLSQQLTPSTNGTLTEGYDGLFTCTGTKYVTSASFKDNWGSFKMDSKTFMGVIYAHQHWDEYDLMNIFSVSSTGDEIGVIYVYCQGSSVVVIYSEDFTHQMTEESASGLCQFNTNQKVNVKVSFPPISASPKPSTIANNINVTGSKINITNSVGTVNLNDGKYDIIVFSTVNCMNCGDGGWYELHSFLHNAQKHKICFTIFYLEFTSRNNVLMEYSLCLTDLTQPANDFKATWSGSLPANGIAIASNSSDAKIHSIRFTAITQ